MTTATKKSKVNAFVQGKTKILKDLDEIGDQMVEIKVPHQSRYGEEKLSFHAPENGELLGKMKERRVRYENEWYIFKETKGKKDILEKIPVEVRKAERDKFDAEEAKRLKKKGHDCNDFVCHGMYSRENGSLNDYYYCGKCNDLLQTG
jgi:hypothetical protein